MARILVIAGFVLAAIVNKYDRLKAAGIYLIVTLGILYWGLNAYFEGGTMTLFGIKLSLPMFLFSIMILFILYGAKLRKELKKVRIQSSLNASVRMSLENGVSLTDAMRKAFSDLSAEQGSIRNVVLKVLNDEDYHQILNYSIQLQQKDQFHAYLNYMQSILILYRTQQEALKFASESNLYIPDQSVATIHLPGVSVASRGAFSSLLIGDILYAVNECYIRDSAHLNDVLSKYDPDEKIVLHFARNNRKSGKWKPTHL